MKTETEKSQKVHIALAIAELFIGGAEKALVELALHLDQSRFEPVVYVLRSREFHSGKATFIPTLERAGIPIRFLDIAGPIGFLRAVGRLKRELIAQKADVLQTFMFHANFLGRFAARLAKVPFVAVGIRVSEKERSYHLLLDRWTSSKVDAYVCVSRSVADFTIQKGKIPAEKIVVIPNGVTEKPEGLLSQTTLFSSFPNEKRIVFIGRLTWQKGLDWLLSTAESWLGAEGNKEWSLWLIGEGPLEKPLKDAANALPKEIAAKIHFAGWRSDIPAILTASDILILPSRYEGMPNVLLEASSAGLSILSSHCDGADEILGEHAPNQTFEFGNEDEFAHKLCRLLKEDSLRHELGNANRRRVLTEFSIEKMVERYEKLWTASFIPYQTSLKDPIPPSR